MAIIMVEKVKSRGVAKVCADNGRDRIALAEFPLEYVADAENLAHWLRNALEVKVGAIEGAKVI